jgi:endoglucanase
MPTRRQFAIAAGALGAMLLVRRVEGQSIGTATEDWSEFRRRYLLPEGRIVDTGNRNVSHSEGQGYAMLAAVQADDQGSLVASAEMVEIPVSIGV